MIEPLPCQCNLQNGQRKAIMHLVTARPVSLKFVPVLPLMDEMIYVAHLLKSSEEG